MENNKVVSLTVPEGEDSLLWVFGELERVNDRTIVGAFWQEDTVICGILDPDRFLPHKTSRKWREFLKKRFDLVSEPTVYVSVIVLVRMPVYAMRLEEVVISFNRLLSEKQTIPL